MNPKCEINGSRFLWKVKDIALRSENKDLLSKKICGNSAEEIAAGAGVGGPVEELLAQLLQAGRLVKLGQDVANLET